MDKHRNLLILFCLLASMILVFYAVPKDKFVPAPVPVVKADEPKLTTAISPDGKFTLTMKEAKSQDSTTYTFSSTKINYAKTVPVGDTLSIPFNTFSPDNKYVFLKEESAGQSTYFVVTPTENLDINATFTVKYPDLVITDVTGWAAPTLLIINTKDHSFWFDVASKSFIQLGTRFN